MSGSPSFSRVRASPHTATPPRVRESRSPDVRRHNVQQLSPKVPSLATPSSRYASLLPPREGSPAPTSPASLPRSSPVVRRTESPMRSFTPQSREGRLSTLVHNFQQLSLKAWFSRLQEIEQRQIRLRLLTEADASFLEQIRERNRNFMRTIEAMMHEAVHEETGIENSVVRHSYAAWRESNELSRRIELLQDKRGPKNSGRLTSSFTQRQAEERKHRGSSPSSASRGVSPAQRGVSPAPRSEASQQPSPSHPVQRLFNGVRASSPSTQ